MSESSPKAGVGLLLLKGNAVLLGKRIGIHGEGEYEGAGGHLELQESFEDAVKRELREEAGDQLQIKNLRFLCVTNFRRHAPKHYVDIGMTAEWANGEAKLMEPEKHEAWQWYPLDDLPEPLFGVVRNYVIAYKTGQTYFQE